MPDKIDLIPDDDFASDIIGIKTYSPEDRRKKDFLPWHKPRKQFVRSAQWVTQINKMVDKVMPENNILKYLGLPGDDLLDIRYFHQYICVPKNLVLKYLGFNRGADANSAQRAELNISLDEVNKLSLVDPTSHILGDDFCQIANENSIAWHRSKIIGPYDVINIDLCDGFGKHHPEQFKETHYNTLFKLLNLQARRVNPWLLLLTTRSGPKHVEKSVFEKLKTIYEENLNKNESFKNSSTEKYSIGNLENLEEACLKDIGVSNVFLVSLCKWIASIIVDQNPPARMEVKSVLGYKVELEVDFQDLVSIAILIEPTFEGKPDKIGLTSLDYKLQDESAMAVQALDRVSKIKDVDLILNENKDNILDEMIAISTSLLEDARYDTSEYLRWANS